MLSKILRQVLPGRQRHLDNCKMRTTLRARTLTLAEEAVSAADNVRKQMEGQSQKALDEAQEQVTDLSTRNFTMMERQAEL
jgi:hypothetical protein